MRVVRHRLDGPVWPPYQKATVRVWTGADGRPRVYVQLRNVERVDAAGAVDLLQKAIDRIFTSSVGNEIRVRVIRDPGGDADGAQAQGGG